MYYIYFSDMLQDRKQQPDRYIKFSQYQSGGDTVSFFCDSGELLEILNFLLHNQDLGLTVCRYAKT